MTKQSVDGRVWEECLFHDVVEKAVTHYRYTTSLFIQQPYCIAPCLDGLYLCIMHDSTFVYLRYEDKKRIKLEMIRSRLELTTIFEENEMESITSEDSLQSLDDFEFIQEPNESTA